VSERQNFSTVAPYFSLACTLQCKVQGRPSVTSSASIGCHKSHTNSGLNGRNVILFEKLDFLVRYWQLSARHATIGEPLSGSEQRELLALLQLVTSDLPIPRPGALLKHGASMPAQVIGDGGIRAVEIRNVSAGALLVASLTPFAVGSRVILRAADAVVGVEYAIPCRVHWSYPGAPNPMALVVDGFPTRSDFESKRMTGNPNATLFAQRHERLMG
jgi:hypothetical protein